MNILDKLEELNDENLLLVSNMIETLYNAQSKKKGKRPTKPKTVVPRKRLKPPIVQIEDEQEDDDDDDEWEVLPKNKKKKKVRPNKFLSMPEYDMEHDDQAYLPKNRVPRVRGSGLIEITCFKCNKPFKIAETLLPKGECRLRCNKCSKTGAG
jgi:hypothetical protein